MFAYLRVGSSSTVLSTRVTRLNGGQQRAEYAGSLLSGANLPCIVNAQNGKDVPITDKFECQPTQCFPLAKIVTVHHCE